MLFVVIPLLVMMLLLLVSAQPQPSSRNRASTIGAGTRQRVAQ